MERKKVIGKFFPVWMKPLRNLKGDNVLRKFFGILLVLLLCAFPMISQDDSPPFTVPVSATFTAGCQISIIPGAATWAGLAIPTGLVQWDDSDEGAQPVTISWRLPNTSSISFVVETITDLEGASATLPMQNYLKHLWTGDIVFEGNMPSVLNGQVEFYSNINANGLKEATVLFQIKNALIFVDTYIGQINYTILDVV